jgi:hypothetical protein
MQTAAILRIGNIGRGFRNPFLIEPPRLPIKSSYGNSLESFLSFRARCNLRLAQKAANLAHLCFLNRLTRRF